MESEDNVAILAQLRKQIASLSLDLNKKRPLFVPDFPVYLPKCRKEDDELRYRVQNILCRIRAFKHDFERLIEHFNDNRITVSELPDYCAH
jgi:hypothetical protein